jgi:histidinol phosphatase-like PHP family hydrolase
LEVQVLSGAHFSKEIMIDLHTHSLFSDGVLLPSELVYRAKVKGYEVIGLTDHGDLSTFDFVIPRIRKVAKELSAHYHIEVIPGIELTYVPPARIRQAVQLCRKLGAKLIVVHGETVAETVPPGTNRAGILSGADILAHPGRITDDEVKLARENNIALEITTRKGHDKTNKHVASLAKKYGARMVLDTDTHEPDNLLSKEKIQRVLRLSGLSHADFSAMQKNSFEIAQKVR